MPQHELERITLILTVPIRSGNSCYEGNRIKKENTSVPLEKNKGMAMHANIYFLPQATF
jgi:hypothetical protein